MKRTTPFLAAALLAVSCLFSPSLHAEELRISVAASMTEVFKELIAHFSREHPAITVLPNFGPSGGLAKQINQGAPADLYVSANPKWMQFLLAEEKIERSSLRTFAHNSLVFVGCTEQQVAGLSDLPNLERIGIGSPKSVPAGQYARQALEKAGLYEQLLTAGKLVMAKDVRQALIYADRGETDGSFVYKTDARLAGRAKILFEVPRELYSQVTYPLAMTRAGSSKAATQAFYAFVTSRGGGATVSKYGFSLPE
ncbi:molybdate ABC transporter substrate-binding protein [Desulfogranum mediterraneum]|uniref:molybdate ABC transporter substrate-binding protein n=1 Tax=Desulfogranum mediterraneum TaxID=160661 RepID=UPI000416A852|nr:molybdate ABC transporter substrate-binding protein [Desulfogranum mediterraneum]